MIPTIDISALRGSDAAASGKVAREVGAVAAPTAGLMPTSSVNLGDWAASRLVQPKSRAGKR